MSLYGNDQDLLGLGNMLGQSASSQQSALNQYYSHYESLVRARAISNSHNYFTEFMKNTEKDTKKTKKFNNVIDELQSEIDDWLKDVL